MLSRSGLFCVMSLLMLVAGCGSGSGGSSGGSSSTGGASAPSATGSPNFTLAVVPATVTVTAGGPAQALTVTAAPVDGFTGTVTVSVGALPSGLTASPMTISLAPGTLQQIAVTAGPASVAGSASIALQGSSGSLTHSVSAAVSTVVAGGASGSGAGAASLSNVSYSFGNNLVNNTVTATAVTVTNTGTSVVSLSPSLSGDAGYALVSSGSCGAQLAAAASCPVLVSYTPTTVSSLATQNATLNLGLGNVAAGTTQLVALSGTSSAMPAGVVTATDNPQVALYTMTLPFAGSMTIHFGKDTTYGTQTWQRTTPDGGGEVSILVAGMQASSTYHMQAAVQFSNGISATDVDHTFATQAVPANMQVSLTATSTPGMTPQPGIELLNLLNGTPSGIAVIDLAGNILWTYAAPGLSTNYIQGVKQLPDGNFIMAIGPNSVDPLSSVPTGSILEIREVNLAGDVVRETSVDDLNAALASATCAECNVTLATLHHDVEPLPNGHLLVLANTTMVLSQTTTPVLKWATGPTPVLGDVVIDLDENLQPVWVWNAFNHMDPSHHPWMFPDWTHANTLLYSPDDGNLLISMRHENWVIKIDYQDGKGTGALLWRLGQGGNFSLINGVVPTDWAYAQHDPAFFTANTKGIFSLGVMDNGDDRQFAGEISCDQPNNPPCLYSSIPVFQIDETAMTATLVFHQILPGGLYSFFGGSVGLLSNANIEYALCSKGLVYEVTPQSSPQTVWNLHVNGTSVYRANRMPSLYPGVQW